MGILVDRVRSAFRRYKNDNNPYKFAKTMVHIGDYSIQSEYNAKIVYNEILKIENESRNEVRNA